MLLCISSIVSSYNFFIISDADNACQVVHITTNVSESNEPKEFKSILDKYNGNSFSFLGMFTGYAGQSVVYVDIKNPKQFLILAPTSYNSYVWILLVSIETIIVLVKA